MRVLIDATPLLLRSAGVKSYLYHWIEALRALSGDFPTFPPLASLGALDHEHSVTSKARTVLAVAWLHARNHLGVPLPRQGAAIFHATNQVRRAPRGMRLTATLHDFTCWTMPHFHTAANVEADRNFANRILKRADGLIAVSEHTRRDALRILDLKPEKVRTIHSGVPQAYFDASAPVPASYGLKKPYALFVGTIEPRKNLDRLVEAWLQLSPAHRSEFELVVAGPVGWAEPATLARLTAVRCLGYVPERDLPAIMRGALFLAYPSLYEGFGFPVAQSLAAGVPVLTSNVSSLPEVAGPGGLLVDPNSASEIRQGLLRMLEDVDLRARLGSAGRAHAEHFRWPRVARESIEFWKGLY